MDSTDVMPDHAWDLPVYRHMLDACFQILSGLIPSLPDDVEAHLVSGLARSCQRVPDLIALGVATWHGPQPFPYLDLASRECQDMIQRLRYCQQAHGDSLDLPASNKLLEMYQLAVADLRSLVALRRKPAAPARRVVTPPPAPVPSPRTSRPIFGMGLFR
jgi:hypothetical protein